MYFALYFIMTHVFGILWVSSEVAQSCPTLCDHMDCSLPGSSVHGISRQEYWSGLPFPSPGNLPYPGNEPRSPTLQADSLLSESPGNPLMSQGISKCTFPDIINTSASCEMCKGSTKPGTILNQNFGLVILKLRKVTLLALIHVRTVLGVKISQRLQVLPTRMEMGKSPFSSCEVGYSHRGFCLIN